MKRKRRLELFPFYDTETIAAHLSRMAEHGWALSEINQYFWTYTQIPPEQRTYGIAFFPGASQFDPKPTAQQAEYLEYCEEARWHYVAQWHQMQIFYTTAEHPTPLETDEALKLEVIHRSMKKSFLPGTWALLALFAAQLFFQRNTWESPLEFLANGTTQMGMLTSLMICLLCVCQLFSYYRWHRKSRAATEAGGPCQRAGIALSRISLLTLVCVCWFLLCQFYFMAGQSLLGISIFVFLLFLGMFWLLFQLQKVLKKRGVCRETHLLLTILVSILLTVGITAAIFAAVASDLFAPKKEAEIYTRTLSDGEEYSIELEQDTLPLTATDLAEIPNDAPYSSSCRRSSSFLASATECSQLCFDPALDVPELEYEIYDLRISALADWALPAQMEYILERRNRYHTPASTYAPVSFADGIQAWQLYDGDEPQPSFIWAKDSRIIRIHISGTEVTAEQWEQAADILFDS
ncbi:DUF2812 domain-containing protein [Anaerotignum lactatifermentans]|uniref:DUF2812 domain-containing protein n=1 Tax=Anaerotignum lactatifermentans TaxID=160404 RepID=A0ABS2G984_9FIRM|nr:DUF2812 domain-containing protein [Anaerotignum lactatifermentans]MBM6829107.1 DUF2812 domain-containing protein [Anaerotignum lactatifermentans]MBM6877285.1 DUF2812 domain-containing protein [Anaerotignum lactatifermentans]MBM6950657.1 DUF2812 domain-containing protein [Anaerotignum lactatifermentans]